MINPTTRIAIIGAGISGMAAAYLLRNYARVTLFEKEPKIGGHSRTLNIDYDGKPVAVDTGFIVYNEPNYPNLVALFKELNVETIPSNMSLAISVDDGAVEWSARSLNGLFGQRKNLLSLGMWRGIFDVLRFNRSALGTVRKHPELSLGELVAKLRMGKWFRDYYLLPMGAAIWSCPASQMLEFPASSFVEFFENHGLLTINHQPLWRTVKGGSQHYVQKIKEALGGNIRVNANIAKVSRNQSGVVIHMQDGTSEAFDRVIFACHANTALSLIDNPTTAETTALGAFSYQENSVILHRDEAQMPARKRCWSSWNYIASTKDKSKLALTYWMNLLQTLDNSRPLFVTLNPIKPIDEAKIFNKHIFEHPVFTHETTQAQKDIAAIQGDNHTWFCGAHLGYGFHEDGLKSAVNVVNSMGIKAPWQ